MGIVDFLNGNSKCSEMTRIVFYKFRLYYPWNLYSMWKMRTANPVPKAMLEARVFFNANIDRVNNIRSILADELSKNTFDKLIHMRQYYSKGDIPQYNYFNQYFPEDIISLSNEVFVDGGAFTGDTLLKFAKLCPNYKRIIAFEPDKSNITKLKNKIIGKRDIYVVEAGMADRTGTANFVSESTGMYSFFSDEDTGCSVPVVRIDEVPECRNATFIKMDIEGAEMSALKGAEKTIKENKPKLAICIYHSNEDMIRIAEYIHDLVPEYKIYMRAHNMGIAENVLYAVVER